MGTEDSTNKPKTQEEADQQQNQKNLGFFFALRLTNPLLQEETNNYRNGLVKNGNIDGVPQGGKSKT